MANTLQSKKRIRQNKKRYLINKLVSSRLRTNIKSFLKAIINKDLIYIKKNYSCLVSLLDKAASKGIIHLNTSSRLKSRLNLKFKSLSKNLV